MSMHDLFEISDNTADSIFSWARDIFIAFLIFFSFFFLIDFSDTISNSSFFFGIKQYARHAFFLHSDGEAEALTLLDFTATETQLPGLSYVRVWASDQLSESSANGKFNPVVYKITLDESFFKHFSYEQRWIVFHEAGHVAAMLTGRVDPVNLPAWHLEPSTYHAMSQSIVYRQVFAESFADVFAFAMALHTDPRDPVALSEIRRAVRGRMDHISLAHDTQSALSIATRYLPELATLKGPKLLALIDSIASQGAVLTVGAWGAEREALCLEGFWGWSRWALDGAHEIASNPWKMAPMDPVDTQDSGILGQLTQLTPDRGWKRLSLLPSWPAYTQRAKQLGLTPQGSDPGLFFHNNPLISPTNSTPQQDAWATALAEYETFSKNKTRSLLSYPFSALAYMIEPPQAPYCKNVAYH